MKKITQKLFFLMFCLLAYQASAQTTVHYEDFLNATGRGFEGFAVADGGQGANQIMKRVSDIPDLADSNNLFDETTDRPANRIPNGTARNQRAIANVGNNGSTNFPIDAYAVFTTLDLTDANALITPSDTYKYASFWTERRYGDGDIATITILATTAFTGDPATTTWTTLSLVSGKLGDSSDGRKYVEGVVDLTTIANGVGGDTVTLAMRYQGSSSPWSGSNRNGTFYFSDLKFFVQPTVLSNKDNVLNKAISIYPNPAKETLNISRLDSGINIKNTTLLDITGKVIYKTDFTKSINVSKFSPGLYLLKLESQDGGVLTKKVVLK